MHAQKQIISKILTSHCYGIYMQIQNYSPIERCLSVYEATIRQNNSTQFTTTTQLYGYDEIVVRTNELRRNSMYTIDINHITAHKNISLNSHNFSEFL